MLVIHQYLAFNGQIWLLNILANENLQIERLRCNGEVENSNFILVVYVGFE
jgi:hypothetical protein